MNNRDELRGTLANTVCNASNYPERAQPYLLGGDMGTVLDKAADAILAAGYSRPRTVSTVAELDALPDEAAVLTRHGAVYIHSGNCWQGIGAGGFYSVWFEKSDSLPASVLYEPEAS